MSWVRLDDKFPRHRRVQKLGKDHAAFHLHVTALCYCNEHLTDGHIDTLALRQIIADAFLTSAAAKRCIANLESAGLWSPHDDDGYEVRDFLDYNPTSGEVKEKREQAKERMRTLRNVRTNKERTNAARSLPHAPTAADKDLDQDLDLELQEHSEGEDSAAAEDVEPVRESELRKIVDRLGGDRRSLDVVEPLAMGVTRGLLLEIVAKVESRGARNPVGLLVELLRDARTDLRLQASAEIVAHVPEPIERLPVHAALEQQIRVLAGHGHPWPTVLETIQHGLSEHLTEQTARTIYDAAAA